MVMAPFLPWQVNSAFLLTEPDTLPVFKIRVKIESARTETPRFWIRRERANQRGMCADPHSLSVSVRIQSCSTFSQVSNSAGQNPCCVVSAWVL